MRPAATQRGIGVVQEDDPQVPDRLVGDARLIEQVLLNYLSNAIKFTEQGRVTLRVRRLADEASADGSSKHPIRLRIEVQDTGKGIEADKLGSLFQAFVQVDRDRRGSGLGLEITRRLVELMGGEISASGELGKGAEFRFTINVWETPAVEPQELPLV